MKLQTFLDVFEQIMSMLDLCKTTNQYIPTTVFHPAETLREKLEEMKMDVSQFAKQTNLTEKTITTFLNEEISLNDEMAIKFENVTQIPANFWMRHQQRYDEFKMKKYNK